MVSSGLGTCRESSQQRTEGELHLRGKEGRSFLMATYPNPSVGEKGISRTYGISTVPAILSPSSPTNGAAECLLVQTGCEGLPDPTHIQVLVRNTSHATLAFLLLSWANQNGLQLRQSLPKNNQPYLDRQRLILYTRRKVRSTFALRLSNSFIRHQEDMSWEITKCCLHLRRTDLCLPVSVLHHRKQNAVYLEPGL